jgi:hypothetical protein
MQRDRHDRTEEQEAPWTLVGLDMVEVRILPQTFDELTVEQTREFLGRMPKDRSGTAWMMIDPQLRERPDSFAFKTREDVVGVLQIEMADQQAGKLTIRYRLEERDSQKPWSGNFA